MPTPICDLCLEPIREGDVYQESLTGEIVHLSCLETVDDEEEDDRDE